MILEKLVSIAFDKDQSIKTIWFFNESEEKIGRGSTKISINAGSRLMSLIEELLQEFLDGYEMSHPEPTVSSIKIKWEEVNPVKCDIVINAKSTKFGTYSATLPSPSTTHITEINGLIRRINEAAFKEYVSYDEAVPPYVKPIYEQPSLFQEAHPLPNLSLVDAA
jgi:hypothetical protein